MEEMISRIKAIEEYLKYYPNDNEAKKNLFACECANAIGMDLDTLSQAEAGTEVTASVCLSPTELIQHGDRIDDDCFCLTLKIEEIDPEEGNITLKF